MSEKGKEGAAHGPVLSIMDKTEGTTPHNTRKEVAADLGWANCEKNPVSLVFAHRDQLRRPSANCSLHTRTKPPLQNPESQ